MRVIALLLLLCSTGCVSLVQPCNPELGINCDGRECEQARRDGYHVAWLDGECTGVVYGARKRESEAVKQQQGRKAWRKKYGEDWGERFLKMSEDAHKDLNQRSDKKCRAAHAKLDACNKHGCTSYKLHQLRKQAAAWCD